MARMTFIMALAACALLPLSDIASGEPLDGAWELKRYNLSGEWLDVSGLLILEDGAFAMIYVMEPTPGALSGRAHAGTYRAEGSRLLFDVSEWVQKVGATASVVPPKFAGADVELTGNGLILHFDGGSIQAFERVRPENPGGLTGAWRLESSGRASAGSMLAAAGRFVVVWLDGEGDGGYAAGGDAKRLNTDGQLDLSWEIRVSGDASLVADKGLRNLEIDTTEHGILLKDNDGNAMQFHD